MFETGDTSVDITTVRSASSGNYTTYKGVFDDPAALLAEYPTGEDGDYAEVKSTNSLWVWSSNANNWVDTGDPGLLFEVR